MSTILKALRRLEQEKTQSARRPLREEVVVARSRSGRPRRMGVAAVAALLAFAATVWLLVRWEGEAPERATTAPAPPPVSAAPTPPRGPIAGSAPTPPAVASPPPAQVAPPIAPGTAVPAPEPELEKELFARPLEPPRSRLVPEPEVEVKPKARAPVPVGVVRTRWHPHGDRRAAWVTWGAEAPREVHEGDRVGVLVVVEIEPDAVLFADGSRELRRAVGERAGR